MIITQPERVLLAKQMKKYAPVLKGHILDVGSGRNNRYHALCTNAEKFTTLDTDPRGQPDILSSAETIPLADNCMDGVLCTQVLEHVPHPQTVMKEIARVLKPGGYCVLTVPQMNELHEVPHDYFRYTCFGLTTMFTDVGLTVEVMDQRGKYHAAMMQMRIRMLINTWRPYERKWVNLLLGPLSLVMTKWALWRDGMTSNKAAALEAIGWCVVARKG